MNQHSPFQLRSPKYRPLRAVNRDHLTTLFACGIVNPMGPTLNALAIEGEAVKGKALPVLHFMLNPFAQEVTKVGTARADDIVDLAVDVEPFFALPLGSCPTLLLHSSAQQPEDAIRLYASLLSTLDDGLATLEAVRRYPGDPWKRVEEMVSSTEPYSDPSVDRHLTPAEAAELAAIQLVPDNFKAEFRAFLYAWEGSIKFQAQVGSPLAESALQRDAFLKIFALLAVTCAIPDLDR